MLVEPVGKLKKWPKFSEEWRVEDFILLLVFQVRYQSQHKVLVHALEVVLNNLFENVESNHTLKVFIELRLYLVPNAVEIVEQNFKVLNLLFEVWLAFYLLDHEDL